MCVVIDLDVVCLVCLTNTNSAEIEMHEIFSDTGDIQIAQKISTLSKLKIDPNNESLPDKICDSCLKDLTAAWRFHKNCQTAVAVFQSILKPQRIVPTPASSQQAQHASNPKKSDDVTTKKQSINPKMKHELQGEIKDISSNIAPIVGAQKIMEEQVDRNLVLDKETTNINSEFLELDQCIVDEEHESYQSVVETAEEDMELVEYYLADDAMHEHQEETIDNAVEVSSTLKGEKTQSTSTIASKKIIMKETTQQTTKLWPTFLTKSGASESSAVPSTRGRTTHTQKLSENKEIPKQIKRASRFVYSHDEVIANRDEKREYTKPQIIQNEDEFETVIRTSKSSRKRKSLSPDTKPPKICEICGNSYRYQHALNAHMRRHFQDKPFPCEVCEKAFVSNVELRRHMRVHTGHKPYPCQYCDRRFSDFGSRIKHERTHTGERPYVCSTCGKAFAYPHVLSVHLRTHTGEKKFRCDHCSKGFTKKAYLLSHIEQHHTGSESKGGGDLTTYELTLEHDPEADTMEEDEEGSNNNISGMKSVKFDDCIFTTEFISEADCTQPDDNEEEVDEEEADSQDHNEGKNTIILQESLLRPKPESNEEDDEDDANIHEVEVHLDDYTIRVR